MKRRLMLVVALLAGLVGVATPAAAAAEDIAARLARVPGLTVVEQGAPAPYRFFALTFTQPRCRR